MKTLRMFLSVATLLSLTAGLNACGHNDKAQADQLIQEDKDRTVESNQNMNDLNATYRINLSPMFVGDVLNDAKKYDWSRYSAEVRGDIRVKLVKAISLANRIDEIKAQKNVETVYDNGVSAESRTNANYYLASLDAYEKTQTVTP